MIDLHIHSCVSDGSESPSRVVELASSKGLKAISLTDHDRFDGLKEARSKADELGIELISGVELSCIWEPSLKGSKEISCHVLVYFVNETLDSALKSELVNLQDDRSNRNNKLVAKLNSLGIEITIDDVMREAHSQGVGRPHFARVLIKKGYAASIDEAFTTYLGAGASAYVKKARLSVSDAIELATRSKGLAVIAHPLHIGVSKNELEIEICRLSKLGLSGIEAFYGKYSNQEREYLFDLAVKNNLIATGGSDFHGTFKPELEIGTGCGDLNVEDEIIERLKTLLNDKFFKIS